MSHNGTRTGCHYCARPELPAATHIGQKASGYHVKDAVPPVVVCRYRIGFDQAGVLLEILYNEVDEQTVNVFHAMKCQSIYYGLIKPRGER
jgi:hypothetical protein